ncbi:MAG: Flp pilus assembly protein CpaB [Stellaceae bacterium]|jgi:pilus assembly protein CpaB
MRGRTLILFVVALMLAGGTAMLVRSWLGQRAPVANAEAIPPPAPQKSILVARGAIARGQILKPADLAWQPWPEGSIGSAYIQDSAKKIEDFAGWVARDPFVAGEPMTEAKMVAPGGRGFLAAVLSPGMRAVSVPVTPTSSISGLVFPGDQVDILISEVLPATGPNGNGTQQKAAETVLHDVRVLAVDQRLENKTGEAPVPHNVTLEVTPKQAEEIAVASEMGKLSLSLRSLAVSSTAEANADSSRQPGTLDTDVSRLLGKPLKSQGNPEVEKVIVLRGSGKSG